MPSIFGGFWQTAVDKTTLVHFAAAGPVETFVGYAPAVIGAPRVVIRVITAIFATVEEYIGAQASLPGCRML